MARSATPAPSPCPRPARVSTSLDTQYALPGTLVVHRARVLDGPAVVEGDVVEAAIDGARRDRDPPQPHRHARAALGAARGARHAGEAGRLAGRRPIGCGSTSATTKPSSPDELLKVEALANEQIIGDAPVRHFETTKTEAEKLGAIAFFGDKYGDVVRVLEAGPSIELCGGTHVHALGFIGPIKIVSEGSVGANLRRIEAVTGDGALARIAEEEATLRRLGDRLRAAPAEVEDKVDRLLAQVKELNDEVATLRGREAKLAAEGLAASQVGGVVVARRDGLAPDELRQLAQATLAALGRGVVALVGLGPDGAKAGIVVAVSTDRRDEGASAAEIARARRACARRRRREAARPRGRRRPEDRRDRRGVAARAGAGRALGAVTSRPGRVLGVDLGSRRIGLALSDPGGHIASPHCRAPARETAGGRPSRHRRRGPRE